MISLAASVAALLLYKQRPLRLVLRILPLLFLCLVIANIALHIRVKKKPSPIVLLIDVSSSFKEHLPEVMAKVNSLKFASQRLFFAESTFKTYPESSSIGLYTNITKALSRAKELDPEAIILISDGQHNFGEAPLSVPEGLTIPVYVFSAGAETLKNLSISDVIYPEYLFINDSARISVEVTSEGFKNGNGRVSLKIPAQNLELKKTFPLSYLEAKSQIVFSVPGKNIGATGIKLQLAPQIGESDYRDNEYKFSLRAFDRKLAVLYRSDHLSFNAEFQVAELKKFANIELVAIAKIAPGKYLDLTDNKVIDDPPDINRFDILIFDNVRYSNIPGRTLKESVNQGKGVLVMGSMENLDDDINTILPIDIAGIQVGGEYALNIVRGFSCLIPGGEYPPFHSVNRVIGSKTDAVIIAEANKIPLIAYHGYGRGLVFQINAVDLGVWQFSENALRARELLPTLLSDIIFFLSPLGRENRLVLKSSRRDYMMGETITLKLESFDKNFSLKGGGDFFLQFGKTRVPFFETEPGFYEATVTARDSGNFEVFATGGLDNENLKSNALKLNISSQIIEISKGINRTLLVELAEKTGGQYFSIEAIENFVPPPPVEKFTVKKLGADSFVVYLLIFLFLAADWFLRRREGTI